MKYKILVIAFLITFILAGMSYAADDQASLGAKTGEAARKLTDSAGESYQTGAMKLGEVSRKMEADARETFKIVQEQWGAFSKRFQEKAGAISQQLQ